MRLKPLTPLACLLLLTPATDAAILPTWPIEYAVERADLIVLARRAGEKGDYLVLTVEKVLHGPAKKGDTILTQDVRHKTTAGYSHLGAHWEQREKPIELKDRPLLVCLSRKSIGTEQPPNAYETQSTGSGTAIKVLDGDTVYGYYQHQNPGPYLLVREGNTRDQLFRRIERGLVLSRQWATIMTLKDQEAREQAILDFLKDRTLPGHFCWQACCTLENAKLVAIIRDEVEHGKDPTKDGFTPDNAPPDARRWTRLATALMHTEDDGKDLLPLLEKIRTARPDHFGAAVRCAAGVGGPAAVPFLKRAVLADSKESDGAGLGLMRIGTPEARAALEDALRTVIVRHGSAPWSTTQAYVGKHPDAWRKLAAALEKEYPKEEKVQTYLRETWQALAREEVLKPEDVPPRFRAEKK